MNNLLLGNMTDSRYACQDSNGMPLYDLTQQTPLTEAVQLEQYQIDAVQVVQLLRNLNSESAVVTAYFDGGRHFMLTSVMGVLRSSGLVVLDYGPDAGIAERALAAGRLICAARLDGVTVRFTLESITSAKYEGRQAIAAPLPQSAYRFQRRNLIRVKTPTAIPATCQIPLLDGGSCTLPLYDISCGGIGVVDTEGRFTGELLREFSACRLSLPELGELCVDLQVRGRYHHHQPGSANLYRYGMQFMHLTTSDTVFLQRYITRLQMTGNPAR